MSAIDVGWPLAALLVMLALLAAGVSAVSGLSAWRRPLTAGGRAAVQLAAVSLAIAFVLGSLPWTLAFVGLMTIVAAMTSCRRIVGRVTGPLTLWMLLPIAGGLLPTIVLCLVSTVVPLEPIAVLPMSGILIGGAMTATTLAGQRVTETLRTERGQYEAALAVGLSRRQAVDLVARPAAAIALVPGQDQTRTVGLVTLPGAFVGVLLAGASPAVAGATQLLVLLGLLAVQAIAAAITVQLVAAGQIPSVAGAT